jgi:hypothetical protein
MTATYKTHVYYSPPTPLGLLRGNWFVCHWCKRCHEEVATDELIAHSQQHAHDDGPTDDDGA